MKHWQDLARTLERGLFDGIFLADVTGVYDVYEGSPSAALRTAIQVPANDPFSIVPVMAGVTEHLCFGVTGSIPLGNRTARGNYHRARLTQAKRSSAWSR